MPLVTIEQTLHQSAHTSMRQILWQIDMLQLVPFVIECLDSFAAAQ